MRKKFENVMIVSDVDGTFVSDYCELIPENMKAISYFKENGGLFTFATGRTYSSLMSILPNSKDICNIPAIMCNGSYIYDFNKEKKFNEIYLDHEKALNIFNEIMKMYPNIGLRIIIGDEQYSPFLTPSIEWEIENVKDVKYTICPLEEMPKNWNKAVYVAPNEDLLAINDFLKTHLDESFNYCFSVSHLLEIQPSNGTKGSQLIPLKKYIGKEEAVIFAIGDHENDLDMLEKADFPMTPKSGIERLKQIPGIKTVCSNNDGAIADLIDEIDKNSKIYKI